MHPSSSSLADWLVAAAAAAQAGRLQDALSIYQSLLQAYPNRPDVLTAHATTLVQLGRFDEALAMLNRALRHAPDQPIALNSRGVVLCELGLLDRAADDLQRAAALGLKGAYRNWAKTLTCLGRHQEALDIFAQALVHDPDQAGVHFDIVLSLQAKGRLAEALEHLEHSIALRPDHAEAHQRKAELLLCLDRYQEGWELFEWRWRGARLGKLARHFTVPVWDGGQAVADKTIFLYHEQGQGDTLQFMRFIAAVAEQAGTVIFQNPPNFGELLKQVPANVTIMAQAPDPSAFDFHCPMMSLARALRLRREDLPVAEAYLAAPDDRRAVWSQKLGPRTRRRVGLVWSGQFRNDLGDLRSMSFEDILPLLECDAVFYSLQKHDDRFGPDYWPTDPRLHDLGGELTSFAETAAIMEALDLIITIDSAPAHLAGGLGRPVWVMLWNMPDWRWGDGPQSPWYPSSRLFRQREENSWESVIKEVETALRQWLAGTSVH